MDRAAEDEICPPRDPRDRSKDAKGASRRGAMVSSWSARPDAYPSIQRTEPINWPTCQKQVMIPKASGKLRKLGIPTVTDRVVQAALKLVLEPIFEADFQPCSYGFRPNRRAADAIAEIDTHIRVDIPRLSNF